MENVDSILAFLDKAETAETHRKIPTNAELKKKSQLKEISFFLRSNAIKKFNETNSNY